MAIYPRGKKFMASVGAGANRVRKTFNTEAEAQAWEASQDAAREAVKASPAAPVVPAVWTMQRAYDETVRHSWRNASGKTLINANQALAFFGADTPTSAITANWVMEWMAELQDVRQNSDDTCNKKLSALSMILKRAMDFGGLQSMPRLQRYKSGDHRISWFTEAEEAQMLKLSLHLGLPDLHDFIVLGIDTGFRRTELLSLRLADYVGGMLVLHAGATKTGKARSVPLRERGKVIMDRKLAAGGTHVFPGMTPAGLRKQWETLRQVMGREDDPAFIPHVMRHTCATRLVAEGVPINTVMVWMGHKAIQTTLRYAHMDTNQLQAAVARLESRGAAAVDSTNPASVT